jgi:hypothetical protein
MSLSLVINALETGLAGVITARIMYLYYVKGNLKRIYDLAGVLLLYIIIIGVVDTLTSRYPSPPTPPIHEWVGLESALGIDYWVLAIIDGLLHIIIPELPNEIDPLQAIARSLMSAIILTGYLTALYTVLHSVLQYAPLIILAGLYGAVIRPRSAVNGVLLGIGLSLIIATPILGYFITGFVGVFHALLTHQPPCLGTGLTIVQVLGGPEPLVINTTQGWGMTTNTSLLGLSLGWHAGFITWACEPFKITDVVWDWLGLNYTVLSEFGMPPFTIVGVSVETPGQAITCSNGSCGVFRIISKHQLGLNASLTILPNNTLIIRNESITLWAWAGGYKSNCTIRTKPSHLYPIENLTQLYEHLGALVWPLNTFEEPPAAAPTNYTQVIINATAYNETCVLALVPGGPPWNGHLGVPITGPIMWFLGWVVELGQAASDLYTAFTSAITAFAVSIALSIILGIGLGPELDTAIGLTGFTIVRIIESVWNIARSALLV